MARLSEALRFRFTFWLDLRGARRVLRMVSGSRLQPFMYWQDSLLMSVTSMVISACVCVTVEQQSTSSWSGVIEPARCVKSLNNRRQEQVELNGRRERVKEPGPSGATY